MKIPETVRREYLKYWFFQKCQVFELNSAFFNKKIRIKLLVKLKVFDQ